MSVYGFAQSSIYIPEYPPAPFKVLDSESEWTVESPSKQHLKKCSCVGCEFYYSSGRTSFLGKEDKDNNPENQEVSILNAASSKELLAWVNENHKPKITKIEQLSSGVVYCHLVNKLFPGSVPLAKIKLAANTEEQRIHNFKLVEAALQKNTTGLVLPVEKLVRSPVREHLAFLSWFKNYFEENLLEKSQKEKKVQRGAPPKENKSDREKVQVKVKPKSQIALRSQGAMSDGKKEVDKSLPWNNRLSNAQLEEVATQYTEMKVKLEGLEKERDFYFGKLRDIEIFCQEHKEAETSPIIQNVLAILYEVQDGFTVPVDGK